MANVIEFTIRGTEAFTPAMSKIGASLGSVGHSVAGFTGKIRSMGNQIFSTRNVIGILAGSTGLGLLAKSFLNAASTTEQLKIRMGVLLGSVEEGNQLFKNMAEFAGKVPFQLEEINNSATMLSGIMRGGKDEITQWMPLIGDLAATTGLSIQTATEQVSRMLSSGANSAELFKDRGILATLGFQAGVAISAEETKKKLIAGWVDTNSRFAGATQKLAKTWDGTMSMISDKWFQFRSDVMDSGLFDFIKGIAKVIDKNLGEAIKGGQSTAKAWSDNIIVGIKNVGTAIGWFMDGLRGIELMWIGLKIAGSLFVEGILFAMRTAVGQINILVSVWTGGINLIIDGLNALGANIPHVSSILSDVLDSMDSMRISAHGITEELKTQFDDLALQALPSEKITTFFTEVQAAADEAAVAVEDAARKIDLVAGNTEGSEAAKEALAKKEEESAKTLEILRERLSTEAELESDSFIARNDILMQSLELNQLSEEEFNELSERTAQEHMLRLGEIRKAGSTDIEKFQALSFANQTSTALGEMGKTLQGVKSNNKAIMAVKKAAGIAEAMMNTYIGVSQTIATYPYPWVIPIAAAHLAMGIANVASISGSAAGGLTKVPDQGTFTLHAGERILSPRQNRDLTEFLSTPPPIIDAPDTDVSKSVSNISNIAQGNVVNEQAQLQERGTGGGVVIESLTFHVLENATSGEAMLRMSANEWREIIAQNVIPAFNVLDDAGIRPKSSERQRDV